mmetsp:Transcript_38603/g.34303  ORF Transcript_38603/g.34303 Transcript_38603/m.34303 type:complete len:394 (-) Transcript_38603:3845-5026(-)
MRLIVLANRSQNNTNPSLNILILSFMRLDRLAIELPDSVTIELNELIEDGFDGLDTNIVTHSAAISGEFNQIQVRSKQNFLGLNDLGKLLQSLGELEDTLDDQTKDLGIGMLSSVLDEEVEQDAEHVVGVGVFEDSEHGGVQSLDKGFVFVVLEGLVLIFSQEPGEHLISKVSEVFFGDILEEIADAAEFVSHVEEVEDKFDGDLRFVSLEDVGEYVVNGVHQDIGILSNVLLVHLVLRSGNFVEEVQSVKSVGNIAIYEEVNSSLKEISTYNRSLASEILKFTNHRLLISCLSLMSIRASNALAQFFTSCHLGMIITSLALLFSNLAQVSLMHGELLLSLRLQLLELLLLLLLHLVEITHVILLRSSTTLLLLSGGSILGRRSLILSRSRRG